MRIPEECANVTEEATNQTADFYANCAKTFSSAGHQKEAQRLRPDDEKLKAQLRAL